MEKLSRQKFLHSIAGLAAFPVLAPANSLFMPSFKIDPSDPIKPEIVKEFVVAGHGGKDGDLDKLKSMAKDYPNIVHASYDWGNGDFETAIEGAGHMGNQEIANLLLASGARVSLFVLAMLGKTELVKPILEAYPQLIFANGPHGFTLLHHAKKAGKDGETLVAYLQEKGLTEVHIKIK